MALNVSRALRGLEEHVEIRAFIAEGTSLEAITTALGDLNAFPEVQHVEYVTPEMALARARKELGEFSDVFDANVLPGSLDVRLKEGYRDPDQRGRRRVARAQLSVRGRRALRRRVGEEALSTSAGSRWRRASCSASPSPPWR